MCKIILLFPRKIDSAFILGRRVKTFYKDLQQLKRNFQDFS